MAIKGERYAMYVDGKQFTNNIISQINDIPNSNSRVPTFVPTSTTVDIIDKGVGQIVNGSANISFRKEFRELASDTEPVIVTVTPIGRSANLYIQTTNKNGFTVIDDSPNKTNNLTFTWIAIAVRKGYENPVIPNEILAKDFDYRLDKYLHNDSDTLTSGEPMWWDGVQLRFDNPPIIEDENKNIQKTKIDLDHIKMVEPKTLNIDVDNKLKILEKSKKFLENEKIDNK